MIAVALGSILAPALMSGPALAVDEEEPGGPDDTTTTTRITVLPTTTTTAAPTTTETLPPTTETAPPPTAAPPTAPPATAAPAPTTVRPVPTTAAPVPTTTTTEAETFTTTANLLVAGDGTEGSEATTTTDVSETQVVGSDGIDDSTLVALIIAGLVVVAVAVAVLTWRYWLATRPVPRVSEGAEVTAGAAPDAALTRRSGPGSA